MIQKSPPRFRPKEILVTFSPWRSALSIRFVKTLSMRGSAKTSTPGGMLFSRETAPSETQPAAASTRDRISCQAGEDVPILWYSAVNWRVLLIRFTISTAFSTWRQAFA